CSPFVQESDHLRSRGGAMDVASDDPLDGLFLPAQNLGKRALVDTGRVESGGRCSPQIMKMKLAADNGAYFHVVEAVLETQHRPRAPIAIRKHEKRALRDSR